MSGEPEPIGGPDKLGEALRGVRLVWLGLLIGAVTITAGAAAFVATQGPVAPEAEMPFLLVCLVLVLVGLLGAFVFPSMALPAPRPQGAPAALPGLGAYMAQFFIRAGLLEGPAIICAVGLLVTGNWALLAGSAVLLGALAAIGPTRARVEAFAESERRQTEHW